MTCGSIGWWTIKRHLCLCALLTLMLVGCDAHISDTLAPDAATNVSVSADSTIGQSFVARHAGLQSIDILLATDGAAGDAPLTLHLRSSALPSAPDLRVASLMMRSPAPQTWYHFAFDPIDARNQSYYFFVESRLPVGAMLHGAQLPSSAYRDGALYVAQRAQDGQLSFRASYAAEWVALDLLSFVGQSVLTTLAFVVVFVVPGMALQTFLLPLTAWRARIALAAALSLCVYPLVLLWARVADIALGAWTVVLPVVVASCALTLRAFTQRDVWMRVRIRSDVASLAWWITATLVLSVQLFILRGVDAPMLGDSVQHTVIAQLLLDHGGLFDSWQPYAPYSTLTVHYGFHSAVAAFAWLTRAAILDATLLVGQWINFVAILSLSLLAERVSRNRWAGVGAMLVAGLLSPLPNEYLNWGRYPQLLGQALVPAACWLTWRMFDGVAHKRIGLSVVAALVFAGTLLAYYRMPHYVALLVILLVGAYALRARSHWRALIEPLLMLSGAGLVALALMLPWLLHIRGGNLAESVEFGVTQGSTLDAVRNEYQIFTSLDQYVPLALVLAATLVTLYALWRRHRAVLIVALWCIGIALLPASRLLRVPGANNLQGFAIIISLYMPISVSVGYGVDRLLDAATQLNRVWLVSALTVFSLLALFGARQQLSAVKPDNRILAPADLRAMQWIDANVSRDAQFLVDGFLIYGGTSAVGSDGGWWLPMIAHRRNTMPPQYALLSERPNDVRFNDWIVELVTQLRKVGVSTREGVALLCNNHITHVYVGEEQGRIGIPPPQPMLHLADLENSLAFTTIYRQDKVGVFALNESDCR